MKQRSALITVFSLLLALLIAGCSQVTIQVPAPAATEPVEGEAMTGAAAPVEEAAAPVEIEVWHQFTEGVGTQALLASFTAEYEASHPEVRINWNWAGFEQYDQRLRARVESGNPPDAVWNSSQVLTIYAREGWLQRVDEALAGKNYEDDATWSDIFFPNLIEQAYVEDGSEGGGYYMIPTDLHTSGIFYNKKILAAHNLIPPQTYQELLEACDTLQAAGVTCFAQDGGYTPYNARTFVLLAIRIGGEEAFYDTALNKPGTSWVDNPDWLKAAEEYQRLTQNYFQPGFLGSQWPAAQVEWSQGREAMMIIPTWLPSELAGQAPEDLEMDIFRFPAYEGGKGDQTASELKFNGYGIMKGAQHPAEALDFLRFMTSRPVQEALAGEGLSPAAVQGISLPAPLTGANEILSNSKLIPFMAGIEGDAAEFQANVLEPLLGELTLGSITPQEFVAQLEESRQK